MAFDPSLSGKKFGDNVALDLKKKKRIHCHFSLVYFCCLLLSSMASNLPADRTPCATAPHKYTHLQRTKSEETKKNNKRDQKLKKKESNCEVGRTVLCIFGLESQLSGKQSVDCLVFFFLLRGIVFSPFKCR